MTGKYRHFYQEYMKTCAQHVSEDFSSPHLKVALESRNEDNEETK